VTAYNRLNNSVTTSPVRHFTVNVGSSAGTAARNWVTVNVSYPAGTIIGYAMTNSTCIRVQAFENAGFAGLPAAEVQINERDFNRDGTIVELHGLKTAAPYYIRAYVDCNNNRIRDIWEPYGYVCSLTGPNRFDPIPVMSVDSTPLTVPSLIIVNADTDGDGISDGWEYIMTGSNPNINWLGVYGADDWSKVFPLGGMTDKQLMLAGDNPLEAYSLGNEMSDHDNMVLGTTNLGDTLNFRLTEFGMGNSEASLAWAMTIQNTAKVSKFGIMEERSVDLTSYGTVWCVIYFSPSLLTPKDEWKEVERFKVTNPDGSGMESFTKGYMPDVHGNGFYRAELIIEP